MRYLHEDKEEFYNVIMSVSKGTKINPTIIEKDYYVTMILKQLRERAESCVFKGGTSLSKAHHIVNRFSEDIDITFDDKVSRSRRSKMKHSVMMGISEELSLPIKNIDKVQSGRNLNAYIFIYDSVCDEEISGTILPEIKTEITYHTPSPSHSNVTLPISNYIADALGKDNPELIGKYGLKPFGMPVQGLNRTLTDKIFALCDYKYFENDKRTSRHLYDVYVLSQKVDYTSEEFKNLVDEVRKFRCRLRECPSAYDGMSVPNMMREAIRSGFYERDYEAYTKGLMLPEDFVPYEAVCERALQVACSGAFGMAAPPHGGSGGQAPSPKEEEPAEDDKNNDDGGLSMRKAIEDAILLRDADDEADTESAEEEENVSAEGDNAGIYDMQDDFGLEM